MLELVHILKSNPILKGLMAVHYSQPKGFVGRQLIYKVQFDGIVYGVIAGGSATRFLPGRDRFFQNNVSLNDLVSNTFFHVEKQQGRYPCRNFVPKIIAAWREIVPLHWLNNYGSNVQGFESLVELPRTGEIYLRDGWKEVGITQGFTCKRTSGKSTDSWTGRRVWDEENLRPKRVFVRKVDG